MNWFSGIIADVINLLAFGISKLLNATIAAGSHFTNTVMGNVILSGFFPVNPTTHRVQVPVWGAGTFSDMMSLHAQTTLKAFGIAFWVFGWTFFFVSVYMLVIGVSSAGESAVQRERVKKGFISVLVSAVLIWQGQHFALLVTEFAFWSTNYFLNLNSMRAWTPVNGGNQALLNSVVNLLQSILSIIVWVVYQFRELFLYVWMIFFPLAMAFYTNDKTRGITKMWWVEWIYQMMIPLGQSVVFGVAGAVASPSSAAAATASDVFVALAGTIGLLGSAVYVRKLVEMVAQGFGASMVGANHGMAWGGAAMVGGTALTGDVMGKAGVKAARGTLGKAGGAVFNKIDNSRPIRKHTESAIQQSPEVHAGSITKGASMDDIMMGQKLGGHGDALNSGGVGIEGATAAAGSGGFRRGGAGGSSGGGRLRSAGQFGLHSGTAGEMRNWHQGAMNTLRNSNMGTLARTKWEGFKNTGGVMGRLGDKVASTADKVGTSRVGQHLKGGVLSNRAQRYQANRANQSQRLETLRSHLNQTMSQNQATQRLPGMSSAAGPNGTFQGQSTNEQAYSQASSTFVKTLRDSGMKADEARGTLAQAEQHWDAGKHLPQLNNLTPPAQQAYKQAFTAYRPAKLDDQARKAVGEGRVHMPPMKNPHHTQVAQTPAFMNDARNAIMNRR